MSPSFLPSSQFLFPALHPNQTPLSWCLQNLPGSLSEKGNTSSAALDVGRRCLSSLLIHLWASAAPMHSTNVQWPLLCANLWARYWGHSHRAPGFLPHPWPKCRPHQGQTGASSATRLCCSYLNLLDLYTHEKFWRQCSCRLQTWGYQHINQDRENSL
jgi:hypothetical protein